MFKSTSVINSWWSAQDQWFQLPESWTTYSKIRARRPLRAKYKREDTLRCSVSSNSLWFSDLKKTLTLHWLPNQDEWIPILDHHSFSLGVSTCQSLRPTPFCLNFKLQRDKQRWSSSSVLTIFLRRPRYRAYFLKWVVGVSIYPKFVVQKCS